MKQIALTQGKYTVVDDQDYEWLNSVKWKFHNGYVERQELNPARPGKYMTIGMHRRIAGLTYGDPRKVDHWDGNPLNNQRYNLRICTNAQNVMNGRIRNDNSSGFKGIYWSARLQKWIAGVSYNGKRIKIGTFETPEAAHQAYCVAALKYYGEYANSGEGNITASLLPEPQLVLFNF